MKRLVQVLLVIAVTLSGTWAYAGETPSSQAAGNQWEFVVVPYLWMAGVGGDVKTKGREASMSTSFSDIWDNLEFGAEVHVEANKGKWGILFDVTYMDLSSDAEITRHQALGPTEGKVDITEWLVELGGLYQAAEWSLENEKKVCLDLLGGGRYWYMKGELNLSQSTLGGSRTVSASEDWIDPFIGARLRLDLTKKLLLGLRGDIGGFGIGSEFSWNALLNLGYRFTPLISAWLGYRALSVDYEKGSGISAVEYDLIMHGPMIGMGFHF